MNVEEQIQLTAKLKKYFPNQTEIRPSWRHVYGHTVGTLRFARSFAFREEEGIRKEHVLRTLMELRNLLNECIEDVKNVQLETKSSGDSVAGDGNLPSSDIGASHTGEEE